MKLYRHLPFRTIFPYNPTVETIFLQTKLFIPSLRSSLVRRPQLIARLNNERSYKLILVSAPAGYGKTTLITEWIDQIHADVAVCWLSLDEDDSDLQQFFNYLAAAIRPLPHSQSSLLQLLQSPQTVPAKNLMAAFVNDVTPVSTPFLLVLDDYHAVESAEIDRAMAFLLDNMPPQMALVITSRADPGFPISRLRARGELIEFRADDLRFTEAEAAQFLQQSMNLTLSLDQIAALETRTEGWIAGLQMAALSMQRRADTAAFISDFTGSHHFVLDYLVEEVMQSQPEQTRNFLLQTSVFDRLNGSLCTAVTGQEDSRALLEGLERDNMFVVPLDDERQWYRYHHLFADMLQARLMEEQPDYLPTLHRRASVWFEQNGSLPDAIDHAAAAHDVERVADLLELAWPQMDGTFQSAAWLGWAKTVPDAIVRTRPVLGMAYAWAFLNGGEMAAADARLRDVEQCLQLPSPQIIIVDEEQFQSLPASIASARTYHAQALGDMPAAMQYAQQALDLLPEDDYIRRGPVAALLSLMYWAEGDLDIAYQTLADSMNGFQKAGHIVFAISGTFGLADMRIAQGRLQDAVRVYDHALQLALAQGDPPIPGTADIYLGLAGLHHERGNGDAAQQNLAKSEALGEAAALTDWPYRLRLTQAQIKQSQGDLVGAMTLLDEAERLYYSTPLPNFRPVSALKTRGWIAQGKLTTALSWEHEQGLSAADDLSFLHQFEHITLARLRLAQYQQGGNDNTMLEALALLDRLLKAAEEGRWQTSMIEILLLQAVAHLAQDNLALARVPLARALTLAEPEGYVRVFVDEGVLMAQLLADAAAQGIKPAYTGKLLAAFETAVPQPDPRPPLPPAAPTHAYFDPLSKRELEIMTLIAQGLKSKEIADQLVISLNTVLYHIKNIYSKLGVNKRSLAIAKAKELNLI